MSRRTVPALVALAGLAGQCHRRVRGGALAGAPTGPATTAGAVGPQFRRTGSCWTSPSRPTRAASPTRPSPAAAPASTCAGWIGSKRTRCPARKARGSPSFHRDGTGRRVLPRTGGSGTVSLDGSQGTPDGDEGTSDEGEGMPDGGEGTLDGGPGATTDVCRVTGEPAGGRGAPAAGSSSAARGAPACSRWRPRAASPSR